MKKEDQKKSSKSPADKTPKKAGKIRKAGSLKGQLTWGSRTFDPLSPEELKDWGIE